MQALVTQCVRGFGGVLAASSIVCGVAFAGVESKSYAVQITHDPQFSFEDCFSFDAEDGFCSEEALVGSYTQTDFGIFGIWSIQGSLKVQAIGIHVLGFVVFGIGTVDTALFTLQGTLTFPCDCGSASATWPRGSGQADDGSRARLTPAPERSDPRGTAANVHLVAPTPRRLRPAARRARAHRPRRRR